MPAMSRVTDVFTTRVHGSTIGATGSHINIWMANVQDFGARLAKSVDKAVQEAERRKKGRSHLGASVLGRKCLRQVWYGWRWAHITNHQGRLLRLFNRGHREETKMAELLQQLGLEVRLYSQRLIYHSGSDSYFPLDWDTEFHPDCDDVTGLPGHMERAAALGTAPAQYTFSDHEGHFGGSSDGMIHGFADLFADFDLVGPGLLEFKTHGEKSFIDLAGKLEDWRRHVTDPKKNPFTGKGLVSSKIEHYVQMQLYMHYFGLRWGLYCAVNKNADDLYYEVVYYKPEVAAAYVDRARGIIYSQQPPAKISQDPSWWECKFCDFREICHRGATPAKNCRSCLYARPAAGGEWLCERYHQIIPREFMLTGCDSWDPVSS